MSINTLPADEVDYAAAIAEFIALAERAPGFRASLHHVSEDFVRHYAAQRGLSTNLVSRGDDVPEGAFVSCRIPGGLVLLADPGPYAERLERERLEQTARENAADTERLERLDNAARRHAA